MNHPVDLLTDYVDGTLQGDDRDAVRTHLSVCERCREEVALAGGAVSALAAMPAPSTPVGLGDAAIGESERTPSPTAAPRGRRAPTTPRWYRWIGAAAAAAAVLLVFVLVLPNVGQGPARTSADRSSAEGADVNVPPATVVERLPGDLSTADVQALALSYRTGQGGTATPEVDGGAVANPPKTIPSGRIDTTTPEDALACLRTAYPPLSGDPVRLFHARFQGTPAYMGVFLTGPGAGQPPDTVTVIVATAKDCRILSSTRARL